MVVCLLLSVVLGLMVVGLSWLCSGWCVGWFELLVVFMLCYNLLDVIVVVVFFCCCLLFVFG